MMLSLPPPWAITTSPPLQTFFPGFVTSRVTATVEFYREHFGFHPAGGPGETLWLAREEDGARLGLLRANDPDHPAALQPPTRGSGVWLNLEVDEPAAVFARLCAAGAELVEPLAKMSDGVQRFIVRDPNGVLVYVSERTAAQVEATSTFNSTQLP
jgi:catechol 2,3-dioxygenase-like lactoylglutathione lyase family enzyme